MNSLPIVKSRHSSSRSATKLQQLWSSELGLTLVEGLIALMISSAIGALLVSTLVNSTGVFYNGTNAITDSTNLDQITTLLNTDIKQSMAVANGYPVSSPTYVSNSGTLVLKLASLSSNGIIEDTFDYIVYYKDPTHINVLKRQVFVDPASTRLASTQVISAILQSLSFSYYDNSETVVTPTAAVKVKADIIVASKTTSVGTANSAVVTTYLQN